MVGGKYETTNLGVVAIARSYYSMTDGNFHNEAIKRWMWFAVACILGSVNKYSSLLCGLVQNIVIGAIEKGGQTGLMFKMNW